MFGGERPQSTSSPDLMGEKLLWGTCFSALGASLASSPSTFDSAWLSQLCSLAGSGDSMELAPTETSDSCKAGGLIQKGVSGAKAM